MAYILRHLKRHWRLNIFLLLGLTFAAGLLAGLPSYATGIAAQTLKNQLAIQPIPGRNIEISGDQERLTGALYAQAAGVLGDLVQVRTEFSSVELSAAPRPVEAVDGGTRLAPQFIYVWSLDRQHDLAQIIDGQWPVYEPPHTQEEIQRALFTIPPIEVAIPAPAAMQTGLRVGDIVYGEGGYTFVIVGILEPIDAQAEAWWGNVSLFNLQIQPGTNEDTITLPLVVAPFAMPNVLSWRTIDWRLIIDQSQITPDNAEAIESKILSLKTLLSSRGTTMSSNLPNILLAYRESLATLRMVLQLLGVQAFLFVLYALALVTGEAMESLQSEMAVLAGRGASTRQIMSTYILEGLLLALMAGGILGPLAAQGFLFGWGHLAGVTIPLTLPLDARLLALAGAGCGWLVLCLAVYPAARRSVLEWQQRRARPEQLASWQKRGVDVFLLVLGGVAYWQLSSSGSFVLVRLRQSDLADPLLLLGPTLFMLAMALLMLRLFPYLFSGLAWLANRSRGLVLSLGLARLARNPVRPAQVILLISLAAGLIFFTSTYTHTLVQAEEALATYRAGADLRIYPANRSLSEILALPGVKTASLVQRIPVNRDSGGSINILAVDPTTFPLVTAYPPGMTGLTIPVVMGSLTWQPLESTDVQGTINPYIEAVNSRNPIPAMFSQAALGQGQGLDSIVHLLFPGIRLDVKANGILRNFPTGNGAFIIVDRAALAQYINLESTQFTRWKEVWLSVDPGFYDLLDSLLWLKDATLADARQELATLQGNSFLQGMGHAFTLNTAIVSLLSVVGLFLVHYFTARQRTYEFGVLRAEGLSAGQLFLLLAGEALMVALIGLIAGTFLGVGLSLGMHSYLNLLIGRVEEGLVLYRVQVDWLTVFRQATLLSGGYLLATLFSLGLLLQSGIHRVMRVGDE